MDTSISFSKIVATPTLASWSQAYNAGKLFAVLSIEKTDHHDMDSLNIVGKGLLDKLEQEFFATEVKDLESIKKAILTVFEGVSHELTVSFVLCFFNENILYLFVLGKGNAFIKRDGKFGNILNSSKDNLKNIVSSSGFIQDNDLIILTTSAFSEVITSDVLYSSLETGLPTDATEALAPKIHKTEDGRLAAIIIKYNKPQEEPPAMAPEEEKIEDVILNNKTSKLGNIKNNVVLFLNKSFSLIKSKLKRQSFKSNPKKKILLLASIAIAIILVFSIFTAIKNQNNAKIASQFSEVFPQAQKKYDEGESLLDLNKNLARDSFLTAQKILEENKSKFPEKSKEKEKIENLLKNVNAKLSSIASLDATADKRKTLSVYVKNGSGVTGAAAKATDFLKGLGYNVVSTGNADTQDYQSTKIQVKSNKSEFLNLLKNDLSKNYTVGETSSDLSESVTEDTLIIIGK